MVRQSLQFFVIFQNFMPSWWHLTVTPSIGLENKHRKSVNNALYCSMYALTGNNCLKMLKILAFTANYFGIFRFIFARKIM